MLDLVNGQWIPQLPGWILNGVYFLLGALSKSAIDYWLQDRNQENQRERKREAEVRKWKANTRRIIQSLERQYESMNTEELDERNEIRDELHKRVESLKKQKDAAPPDIHEKTIQQIEAVITVLEEDDFLAKETPMATTAVVNRKPSYGSAPSPHRLSSSSHHESKKEERERKAEQRFIDWMESFLQEALELVNLCNDTEH